MRQRCLNPRNRSYARYGGRGIQICEEWQDYSAFHAWAKADGYSPGLSIERVDNNGGYGPDNCKWIPLAQQSRNIGTIRRVIFRGQTRHLREWGRVTGIDARTIASRIDRGWPVARALTEPVHQVGKAVAANG